MGNKRGGPAEKQATSCVCFSARVEEASHHGQLLTNETDSIAEDVMTDTTMFLQFLIPTLLCVM
jgi:hypothetical protein